MPFPVDGGLQTLVAQFNGGPLGGTSNFQRYTAELRSYAPLAAFGNQIFGGQPMQLVTALSARGGVLFGNPGPFFYSQSFALGGTQYGEQLRGYDEFSITPGGYDPTAESSSARRESFGNAYFTATAELGLRLSSALYVHAFAEGGNVWDRPREFNPTRLFRSVGFGGATLSPLGPLGIDLGYGLDKTDILGRRESEVDDGDDRQCQRQAHQQGDEAQPMFGGGALDAARRYLPVCDGHGPDLFRQNPRGGKGDLD